MTTAASPMPFPELSTRPPRDRTLWVGALTIVGILATLFLLFTLTSPAMLRGRYNINGMIADAKGIRRGDPVQMRGVNIGRIKGFKITRGGVDMELEIEGQYKIPADSKFVVNMSSVLGDMAAEIQPGSSTKQLRGGDRIQGVTAPSVVSKAGEIADQASETLGRVQNLLSDQTVDNVESSTANLSQVLADLDSLVSQERAQVASLTQSLNRTAGGLEKAATGPELERSMKRLDALTEQLEGTSRSAAQVVGRINRGEGVLGKLSRDDRLYTNADQAAVNLSQAASELSKLVADIRKDPKRYLTVKIF
ncbi:MAG: MCE family protein [Deltaproteobacteria bacterium]|nr:MCE family protein [Deltaproteobacteria bacterium]